MPDIDLDFEDERREEVIDYIFTKYGKANVAQIITFQTIKGRSSVRDIARVMKIDLAVADKIAKSIPLDSSLKQAYDQYETLRILIDSNEETRKLYKIAITIDGLPRQFSTHAAGMVISTSSIDSICPTQLSSQTLITQYSMNYLEKIGLIKFDILGLRNLTTLKTIIEAIYKTKKEFININKIDIDDKDVYKLIGRGDTSGIFQLESGGMKQVLRKMNPDNLEDIIAASSLFRPGPQENIPSYIKRKNGEEKIDYIDDSIKSILEPTYGIIVYQEQIMKIVQVFASMSLSKADILRRAVGKKDEKLLATLKDDFTKGALNNKHDQKTIDRVYSLIEKFANYGFNRSHAYGYSLLGYQLAYLKTYYPLEFMTALLDSVIGATDKTSVYIQEAKKRNIRVLGPSINKSGIKYLIEKNSLRFALLSMKNVGGSAVKEIVEERETDGEFKDIFDFFARISTKRVSKKVIESLIYGGALDEFGHSKATILGNLDKIDTYVNMIVIKKGDIIKIDHSIVQSPKLEEIKDTEEMASKEFEVLGFYLKEHPIKKVKDVLKEKKKIIALDSNEAEDNINVEKQYVLQILSARQLKTKYGQAMAFATGQDDVGTVDLALFPGKYEKHHQDLVRGKVLLVTGKATKRQNISINISDIVVIK
jgi:DNA polymerase-3 subunit alpha